MVTRRPPARLEEFSFTAWLKALDSGVSIPKEAPPLFLLRVLANAAKVRESTIVRIVQAVSRIGVEHLDIEGEILNPTLLQQLARSLTLRPEKLQKISLDLSPRLHKKSISLLVSSFKYMINLKDVRLTGGANDELLQALSIAEPPLENLDLSYSQGVTDDGLKSLIGPFENKMEPSENERRISTLKSLNIWETKVTTRGCIWALKYCHLLLSLLNQWTLEAVTLLYLQKHQPLNLDQLLISEDEINDQVIAAVTQLCPNMKFLTIRRPKSITLTFNDVLTSMPLIREFTVLQFIPHLTLSVPMPTMSFLRRLYLSSLYAEEFCLCSLLRSSPSLSHLTLEGLRPTVSSIDTGTFQCLKELRINTTFTPGKSLDPSIIVWIINNMTNNISMLDLGCCKNFEDSHFLSMLQNDSLNQMKDLRLSGASNISNTLFKSLIDGCSLLRRLVLKMVKKEKLQELESLKVELRICNIDLELITYGHRL